MYNNMYSHVNNKMQLHEKLSNELITTTMERINTEIINYYRMFNTFTTRTAKIHTKISFPNL